FGSEYASLGGHVDLHINFWRDLSDRSPAARAFLADCLLANHQATEAMAEFARAFAADPLLLHEFGHDLLDVARDLGRPAWLVVGGGDEDADAVRELYGELCDEYRGDPTALAGIRAVGREIDQAVVRGELPRALVRRAPR